MDFSKLKQQGRIEDRTGDDYRNSLDWNYLLGTNALEAQAQRDNFDPHEALKGLTPQQVNNILFQRAMEEYGGGIVNDVRLGFPHKEGINENNVWTPGREDWMKAYTNKLNGLKKK